METWLGGYCESEDSSTCRSAASDAAAWTWVSDGANFSCTGHAFGSANAKVTAAQDPAADAVDSFFDDSCGSGYCIASINGGEFPDCVQGKCCPSAAQETLCNGKCMDSGETCCKDTTVCGFGERCLDDGTCIENDCEAILKYDYGLTGDVVTPDVPDCLTRSGCVSEIKEQGGKQCVRTKSSGGNIVSSSICEPGGYETQCLSDDTSTCGFVNMDGSSSLGECEAQSSASAPASASSSPTYAGIDDNEFCAHYWDGEAGWAADRCSATYQRVAACQVAYAPDPTDSCAPADAPPRPPPTPRPPSTSPTPPPIPSPTAPPSPSTPSPLAPTNVPTPPPPPPRWPYVGTPSRRLKR